ncbi:MAG: hypothetical protein ACO3VQ_05125 [Ilumatobacteraceae bacterium]
MDDYMKQHLATFDELEVWLDDRMAGLDPKEAIIISRALEERIKRLGAYSSELRLGAANKLHEEGIKSATIQDEDKTYTVTVVNKARRTEVDRESLVKAVERLATEPTLRVDSVTGELAPIEQVRRNLIAKVFRFEPRWAEINKLGLQEDEYCSRVWSRNIDVEEVHTL